MFGAINSQPRALSRMCSGEASCPSVSAGICDAGAQVGLFDPASRKVGIGLGLWLGHVLRHAAARHSDLATAGTALQGWV